MRYRPGTEAFGPGPQRGGLRAVRTTDAAAALQGQRGGRSVSVLQVGPGQLGVIPIRSGQQVLSADSPARRSPSQSWASAVSMKKLSMCGPEWVSFHSSVAPASQ